jgi:hypothetical protein
MLKSCNVPGCPCEVCQKRNDDLQKLTNDLSSFPPTSGTVFQYVNGKSLIEFCFVEFGYVPQILCSWESQDF